jgi:hypothetical protein
LCCQPDAERFFDTNDDRKANTGNWAFLIRPFYVRTIVAKAVGIKNFASQPQAENPAIGNADLNLSNHLSFAADT